MSASYKHFFFLMSSSFPLSELIFIFKTVASPWLCEAGPRQSQPFRRGLGRKIMKYRQNGKKAHMEYHQPTSQKVLVIGQNVVVTIIPPPFWHRMVQNRKGNSSMSQPEPLVDKKFHATAALVGWSRFFFSVLNWLAPVKNTPCQIHHHLKGGSVVIIFNTLFLLLLLIN